MQVSKTEYEFRLNTEGNFLRKEELIKEFRGYLGSEAAIAVTFVDEIPLLCSGKRKKVLNRDITEREKKERPE
jgi:phenylacetate-CoA ligase